MGTPRFRPGRFFGGLFFLKAESRSRIKIKLKINCREFVPALAWPGTGGLAVHAVNPSMGARERHPWRPTVPPTHPYPAFDSGLVRNEEAASLFAWQCFALAWPPANYLGRGCVGLRDRWAPWMALTSLQGWIYGVSREPTHPRPARNAGGAALDVAPDVALEVASAGSRQKNLPLQSGFFEAVRCDVLSHVLRVPDAAVHGDVYTAGQRLHCADRAADVEFRV